MATCPRQSFTLFQRRPNWIAVSGGVLTFFSCIYLFSEPTSTPFTCPHPRPRPPSLARLFIQGLFEIIELTHLSDGERRNAKRSPGEVPAAPAPKPSLPPNSTVITPQQMGLLPPIAAASVQHTLAVTGARRRRHAAVPAAPDSHRRQDGRTETCTVHIWPLSHTYTHMCTCACLLDLTCETLQVPLLLASDFSCPRSAAPVCRGRCPLTTGPSCFFPHNKSTSHPQQVAAVEGKTSCGNGRLLDETGPTTAHHHPPVV